MRGPTSGNICPRVRRAVARTRAAAEHDVGHEQDAERPEQRPGEFGLTGREVADRVHGGEAAADDQDEQAHPDREIP